MSEGYLYNIVFLSIACTTWVVSKYCLTITKRLIRLYTFFWLFNSFIIACNFITHDVLFTFKTFLYQSVFFLMGVLGLWYGSARVYTSKKADPLNVRKLNPLSMVVMVVLSAIFVVHGFIEIKSVISIMLSDFRSLRTLLWAQWADVGVPTLFEVILAFINGVAFFTFLTYFSKNNIPRWLYLQASIIAIIFSLQSLAIGGRSVIFYIVFTAIYVRTLFEYQLNSSNYIKIFKKLLLYGSILFCGLFFMVIFPALRGSSEYTDFDLFLGYRNKSYISDYIKYINITFPGIDSLAFATYYFSSPTVKMTNLIMELDTSNLYFYGMYSFSVPAKIISIFAGTNYHQEARIVLENLISSQGFLAIRPWTTSAQDFSMDFGLYVGVIVSFLSTYILAKLYTWGLKINTAEGYALCSIIALCLVIFAFKSPFNITIIANTFFVGCLIGLLSVSKWNR